MTKTAPELSSEARSLRKGIYLHHKGAKYIVLGVALHSETLEEMVVYQQSDQLWIRPLSMFLEDVILPSGEKIPRFKFLANS